MSTTVYQNAGLQICLFTGPDTGERSKGRTWVQITTRCGYVQLDMSQ
jgi:hypothetical protein